MKPDGAQLEFVEKRKPIEEEARLVGSPLKRIEDPRLITGNDHYLDNLKLPDMVFAGFVRSPYAHAKIRSIDLSEAQCNPAVVAIITPAEVKEKTRPVPVLWQVPGAKLHEHYSLAQGKVLHVGDPVVAIAVDDRNKLEDILDSIRIDYERLEPVLDSKSAETLPPIHGDLGTNVSFTIPITFGDTEAALREADVVVSGEFKVSRLAASPMETRGVLANPRGLHSELEFYSSTQWPHVLRTHLAACLKADESKIRVIGPDVGGAFGVKGEVYGEEIVVAMLALKCRRPVKWVEGRKESFVATTHGRDAILRGSAAFKKDGTITGLKVEYVTDFGAYLHTVTPGSCFITAISLNGPYRLPNFSVIAKGVYTNKVGISAYRGFGQPEAAFTVERLMSIAAEKLGMDQSEIRFKNLVSTSEMPYKTATGGMLDSGDYASCLKKALELADYDGMIARRNIARKKKGGALRGVGISFFTETAGFAPGFVFHHLGLQLGGYDSATVKMDPQGKLLVTTGAFPHGQGFNTSVSQICADELGLRLEDVYSFHGDTASSPYGQGSFGSRTTAVIGSAALVATRKLKKKILALASYVLKADDLSFSKGTVFSKSNPSKKVSLAQLAQQAYLGHDLPKDMEPTLEASAVFQPIGLTSSYAANICEVEVDRETGTVRILRHATVHDCGNEINPLIVEGQIHGSLAQAFGACLLEEIVYDDEGQLLTGSFMDYLLPTAETIPELKISSTTVPTPINPLGAKGVGESGTIIAPASIANAVSDALGAEMNTIPMSPERVWQIIASMTRRA